MNIIDLDDVDVLEAAYYIIVYEMKKRNAKTLEELDEMLKEELKNRVEDSDNSSDEQE